MDIIDYKEKIKAYLCEEKKVIDTLDFSEINAVINVFENARLNGNHIFICGNGGSAMTASHFCCDFNKGISERKKQKYNFECLNDNISTMMAIANDISYDEIFRFPLKNKLQPGDVVVGISGSGNSVNIINAIQYAKENGNTTVGFVGYNGGKLLEMVDYHIHVNINNMQIIEDIHMIMNHLMVYVLC